MSGVINVDVWSDVVCPWCYLGTRRFAEGVRRYQVEGGTSDVHLRYRAFELAPDVPVGFEGNEIDYLVHAKGVDPERAARMLEGMAELVRAEGLPIDFARVRPARTLKAHELIAGSSATDRQQQVVDALMRAHFADGLDVSNLDVLVHVGEQAGLSAEETRSALTEGRFAPEVAADIEEARDFGVDGVPYYLINDDIEIFGAQDPDVFVRALRSAEGQGDD